MRIDQFLGILHSIFQLWNLTNFSYQRWAPAPMKNSWQNWYQSWAPVRQKKCEKWLRGVWASQALAWYHGWVKFQNWVPVPKEKVKKWAKNDQKLAKKHTKSKKNEQQTLFTSQKRPSTGRSPCPKRSGLATQSYTAIHHTMHRSRRPSWLTIETHQNDQLAIVWDCRNHLRCHRDRQRPSKPTKRCDAYQRHRFCCLASWLIWHQHFRDRHQNW